MTDRSRAMIRAGLHQGAGKWEPQYISRKETRKRNQNTMVSHRENTACGFKEYAENMQGYLEMATGLSEQEQRG